MEYGNEGRQVYDRPSTQTFTAPGSCGTGGSNQPLTQNQPVITDLISQFEQELNKYHEKTYRLRAINNRLDPREEKDTEQVAPPPPPGTLSTINNMIIGLRVLNMKFEEQLQRLEKLF